jgi:drug/metabolite transporter (DMT)-like permease
MIAGRVIAVEVPVLMAATIRLAIAWLVLLILLRGQGPLPPVNRPQLLAVFAMGLAGIFGFNLFFFSALQSIPASKGALIVALIPVLTALIMALVLREVIRLQRWLGIALALSGVSIVVTGGELGLLVQYLSSMLGTGEGLMLLAALGWVTYTVISRLALKGLSPLAASTYAAFVGLVLLATALASDPSSWRLDWLSVNTVVALIYIATFGTALPYVWFVQGVQQLGPARTAVYINLTPVFGVSLGFLVLGEAIDWSMLIGGLIVIAGVTLTNRSSSS